jgi:hypothetical protein
MAFLIFIFTLVLQQFFLYIFFMNKLIVLIVLVTASFDGLAQIRDFQTTRLHSTAGAGVASVLATEAAILNPATAAFFEGSSFAYHSYATSLRSESDLRATESDAFQGGKRSQGLFLADHSGPIKGGTAYLRQSENNHERERMILHGALPMGPTSSLGVSYRYTRDTLPPAGPKRHDTFHQLSLGLAHIIDKDTTLGLVMMDPTRARPGEERLTGGFQYNIAEKFILIADAGFQHSKSLAQHYHWNAALQLNIFSDFFFRLGQFHDQARKFKGTGWGASWIGPRMGVEFAQRISNQFGQGNYIYPGETLVDTSLSAIIKF